MQTASSESCPSVRNRSQKSGVSQSASVQSSVSSEATQYNSPIGRMISERVNECTEEANWSCERIADDYLTIRPTPKWKRFFDFTVACALMVVLSPLLLLIACYICIAARTTPIFRQKRLGLMGQEFVIYKFRTLKSLPKATTEHREFVSKLAQGDGVLNKPDLSNRMIPGGKWLRSSSLDELPQLWNILRGDMCLIGPRPDVLQWEDYQPWQLRRFEVTPGVTGLWQVSGKNRLTFDQMIEKDIEYVERRSALLDLWIALKTFRLLIARENY